MDQSKKVYFGLYFVLTVIVSFFICFMTAPKGISLGFWQRLLASILSIPTGFIGALIGDVIRRITIPDAIFTNGGLFEILKTKFFWFCVPQLVGMVLGIAVVAALILR